MERAKDFFFGLMRRHIWIFMMAAVIVAFFVLRGKRAVMNAVAGVTLLIKQVFSYALSPLPFSFAELLCALAILAALAFIAKAVVDIVRGKEKLKIAYHRFSFALAVGLTVYALVCLFLGASYYADNFQGKSGVTARKSTVEELKATEEFFVDRLIQLEGGVKRDAEGGYDEDRDEIFALADSIYEGVSAKYSFLGRFPAWPKPLVISKLMSALNYTGFYFPFTGEANINTDQPAALLPSTIAHELAHQRGIASEQEANFVAVLACMESGDPAYAYSGALMAFIHLGNALFEADKDAYLELYMRLPDTVKVDIERNNAYWAKYKTKAAEVSSVVYDSMLKSYGQELGVKSYGACVDLLIAYYSGAGEETALPPDEG